MQATSKILMVRPVNFGFNEQTAASNTFQSRTEQQHSVQKKALVEFNQLVDLLRSEGVDVLTVDDTLNPHTPDSIFPNNWISTDSNGTIYLYPMQAENRRLERRKDTLNSIEQKFKVEQIIDLSYFENEGKFLEGTGSMVLDRDHKIAYASLSIRTTSDVLNYFCRISDYKTITFQALDQTGKPIYHTNVMMNIAERFCVICLDAIRDEQDKKNVVESLLATGKEMVQITMDQMANFSGNILQLKNKKNEDLLVMSERAYHALSAAQIQQLEKYCRIIYSPLHTIENNGGGSARCMIAEIYLPFK